MINNNFGKEPIYSMNRLFAFARSTVTANSNDSIRQSQRNAD